MQCSGVGQFWAFWNFAQNVGLVWGSTNCVLIQSWQKECPLAVLKNRFFFLNLICILRKIVLLGRVFIKMRQDYFMVLSQPALLHWRYYNIQDNIFQCWHFTVNWMVNCALVSFTFSCNDLQQTSISRLNSNFNFNYNFNSRWF